MNFEEQRDPESRPYCTNPFHSKHTILLHRDRGSRASVAMTFHSIGLLSMSLLCLFNAVIPGKRDEAML